MKFEEIKLDKIGAIEALQDGLRVWAALNFTKWHVRIIKIEFNQAIGRDRYRYHIDPQIDYFYRIEATTLNPPDES